MSLGIPLPATFRTRHGRLVRVTTDTWPKHLLHRAFPLRGVMADDPHHTQPLCWQLNGRYALDAPDDLDLVALVTEISTTPFPLTPADPTHQPECIPPRVKEIHMSKQINGFTVACLTAVQAAIINQARASAPEKKDEKADERKQIKREVFSVVKAKFGIPDAHKLKANTTGEHQPGYLVLHNKMGLAYQLGEDGKWNGALLSRDQLFPPPVDTSPEDRDAPASSEFGGTQSGGWFRLDPTAVADALNDIDGDYLLDDEPGPLPTPHLMLAGADDLCIAADGAIYRKQ